ncbi:holin [Erwinia phage Fougasse]|nr:holin [Erwinia phage Berlingot]WJN63876.1 holin [Erwinia phage Calisson]WJN63937.1 holin [Erwinia phage Farigoule]WJN63966.1 holin [Erwinia phage Fougasse]WJN64093.1 holin [Erwinia phage Mauresque]WJN64171.1 holin [Erwinia phage Navette]WJN64199.1 holin [Erwinia phage Nougat]WJN64326.1 holin [Erwinia phage Orgeat]WJN64533.1 holin [Erwinia phage Papaline]
MVIDKGYKVDRQTIQAIFVFMHQYGILHGLLAGLVALIRGAYESEGLGKALLDAALCCVIGTFVFSLPILDGYLVNHPNAGFVACIVIGVVGAKLIITTIRDSFTAAIKQLNPLTWFKKAK